MENVRWLLIGYWFIDILRARENFKAQVSGPLPLVSFNSTYRGYNPSPVTYLLGH